MTLVKLRLGSAGQQQVAAARWTTKSRKELKEEEVEEEVKGGGREPDHEQLWRRSHMSAAHASTQVCERRRAHVAAKHCSCIQTR